MGGRMLRLLNIIIGRCSMLLLVYMMWDLWRWLSISAKVQAAHVVRIEGPGHDLEIPRIRLNSICHWRVNSTQTRYEASQQGIAVNFRPRFG